MTTCALTHLINHTTSRTCERTGSFSFFSKRLSRLNRYFDRICGLSSLQFIGFCEPNSHEAAVMRELNFMSIKL